MIKSRQNERIKRTVKLRDRRARDQQRRTIVDGARELHRALAADFPIEEAFICPPLCRSELADQVVKTLERRSATVWRVTPEVFAKLSFGDRAEGVLGVARTPDQGLADLELPERPLIAVLESIEKPGNLGAILRSADGAGVSAVVIVDGGTDVYNPATIRASLGTVFSLPICRADGPSARAWLQQRRLVLVAANPSGSMEYTQIDYTGGVALALGSEATGLSAHWHDAPWVNVRLPMQGVADSLNVSATASILFYEVLRQRSGPSHDTK